MDPIDRQAAIDAIRKDMYADKDYMSAMICDGIESVLRGLPSVQERKKGRWIRYNALGEPDTGDTFYWQCDKCLKTEKGYMTAWAYCPNCGAHMEGAEDEQAR